MEKRCFFALRFYALDSCDIAPDYDLLPLCRFRFPFILQRNYSAFKLDFNGFSEPRQQISHGQGIQTRAHTCRSGSWDPSWVGLPLNLTATVTLATNETCNSMTEMAQIAMGNLIIYRKCVYRTNVTSRRLYLGHGNPTRAGSKL